MDTPAVGPDLTAAYWTPGNGDAFLDLVQRLTGKALGSDAWVAELEEDLEAKVVREKADYEAAVAAGPAVPADAPEVAAALDMLVRRAAASRSTQLSMMLRPGTKPF